MTLSLRTLRLWPLLVAAASMLPAAACAPTPAPRAAPPPAVARPAEPARDTRAAVRLGVLLPTGGPEYLRQYAAAVLEGVQVAVEERRADPRYRIEYVVREAATPTEVAAAVRALAAAGAVAIVAPMADPDVAAAAAARPDAALPIVSPTGAASFGRLAQVYSLNVPDTLGAAALGRYAVRRGPTPIGVLRSRNATGQSQARAFGAAVAGAGGRVQLEVSYDPGTTTFGTVLRRLRDARVRTIFVAADEGDVRQILPQVRYYGLEGAQVLTTGPWATPDGIARIGLGTLDGAVVTLPFLPEDSAGGWQQFQRAYAEHFRRSLDNALPALGYDAAQLALGNLGARPSAGAVAAALASGAEVRGATGQLRVAGGSVLRRPVLVQVREGRLIPVTPQER